MNSLATAPVMHSTTDGNGNPPTQRGAVNLNLLVVDRAPKPVRIESRKAVSSACNSAGDGVPTRGAHPTISLAMNCNIMTRSSPEARMELLARKRKARILVTASVAARECLSRMLPLLPKSFSMVSACALRTTTFTIPPFQMSHPATWMPSCEKGGQWNSWLRSNRWKRP